MNGPGPSWWRNGNDLYCWDLSVVPRERISDYSWQRSPWNFRIKEGMVGSISFANRNKWMNPIFSVVRPFSTFVKIGIGTNFGHSHSNKPMFFKGL